MSEQILITGATGYLGRYIVREWLRGTEATLHLLVRDKRGESADRRLQNSLLSLIGEDELARHRSRLKLWRGDVTLPHLGLDSQDYRALADVITHILHGAAAARFDLPLEQARATNVAGVRSMLELARSAGDLRRFDYIGTAYVAGNRIGLINESDLDCGQTHRNSYERSKFEAELLLRAAMASLPIMVARPSMILCDSATGASSPYTGFTRALQAYATGILTALPGSSDALLDFVPVDYVAEVLLKLWQSADSVGQTYHLVAGTDSTLSLDDLRTFAAEAFCRPPFSILSPAQFERTITQASVPLSAETAKVLSELQLYAPYLNCRLTFDCMGTRRDSGLSAPHPRSYFTSYADWIRQVNSRAAALGNAPR
jgi:thioester reductase-like protein